MQIRSPRSYPRRVTLSKTEPASFREQSKLVCALEKMLSLDLAFGVSARIGAVSSEPCLEDWCVSEETDKDPAGLGATMVARIKSEGLGSPTHEKAITDGLNAIDGVQEVSIENGAIHVTYDPLQTTEKKIEESIRASGSSVTAAATDKETPGPVTRPGP